jgi:hypothetical protein
MITDGHVFERVLSIECVPHGSGLVESQKADEIVHGFHTEGFQKVLSRRRCDDHLWMSPMLKVCGAFNRGACGRVGQEGGASAGLSNVSTFVNADNTFEAPHFDAQVPLCHPHSQPAK